MLLPPGSSIWAFPIPNVVPLLYLPHINNLWFIISWNVGFMIMSIWKGRKYFAGNPISWKLLGNINNCFKKEKPKQWWIVQWTSNNIEGNQLYTHWKQNCNVKPHIFIQISHLLNQKNRATTQPVSVHQSCCLATSASMRHLNWGRESN